MLLLLWLLTYTGIHARRVCTQPLKQSLQNNEVVHWLVMAAGYAGLSMRGIALYLLVQMQQSEAFGDGAPARRHKGRTAGLWQHVVTKGRPGRPLAGQSARTKPALSPATRLLQPRGSPEAASGP